MLPHHAIPTDFVLLKKNYKIFMDKGGWTNRKEEPLPGREAIIYIIQEDFEGEHEYRCIWHPYVEADYAGLLLPGEGYLGTARVADGPYKGIGFNAWEQNNDEFIYYKL